MNDDELLGRWARSTDPDTDPITGDEVRSRAASVVPGPAPAAEDPHRARTTRLLAAAAAVLVLAVIGSLALVSRGDDSTDVSTGGNDRATSAAGSGPSIFGRQWKLVSLSLNRGNVHVPGAGSETAPTLDLTDGERGSFTGCNLADGPVVLRDGVLTAEDWISEQKACGGEDGDALMEIDQLMGELLTGGATVELDGSSLTLSQMALVARFTDATSAPTDGPGSIQVHLAPSGRFVEGFDLALRFETVDGTTIDSVVWTDFVESTGAEGIDPYYESVLDQPVPLGEVVVLADVVTGAAGPPPKPDPMGDLPCRIQVTVAAGEPVALEVLLEDQSDTCLRRLSDDPATTTTSAAGPGGEPTTTVPPAVTTTSVVGQREPTTTIAGDPSELIVGAGYSVDVDLECEAFDLVGTWVLVEGDPRSWQPADERHEGGTFTLDSPTTGTFRGDAAGTKVATFRLLPAGQQSACTPVPR